MKKSDCTPEEWAKYLEYCKAYYQKNKAAIRDKKIEYHNRPEVKERVDAYRQRPEVKERLAAGAREKRAAKPGNSRKAAFMKRNDPAGWEEYLDQQRERRSGINNKLLKELADFQDNICPICKRAFTDDLKPVGDHCHDSKMPRGALCQPCNTLEGRIKKLGITPTELASRLDEYYSNPPASRFNPPIAPS